MSPNEITGDIIRTRTIATFQKRPCQWQIDLCKAQLQGRHIISVAATGSGKTLSYFMPLQFSADSVIIIVTALNVLGDQFVGDATRAGLSAVSVNAENDNDVKCVALYTRGILAHAPIGEFRLQFFPAKPAFCNWCFQLQMVEHIWFHCPHYDHLGFIHAS